MIYFLKITEDRAHLYLPVDSIIQGKPSRLRKSRLSGLYSQTEHSQPRLPSVSVKKTHELYNLHYFKPRGNKFHEVFKTLSEGRWRKILANSSERQ